MPKLIYQGDKLAAAIFEGADIARVAMAVRYYLRDVALNAAPDENFERPEFERILRDLTTPAPDDKRPAV